MIIIEPGKWVKVLERIKISTPYAIRTIRTKKTRAIFRIDSPIRISALQRQRELEATGRHCICQ